MGLRVSVYRWSLGDCTNGGISAEVSHLCLVNVSGPFSPAEDCPAAELVPGPVKGQAIIQPIGNQPGMIGPMFGGNYASSSDSRFNEAVRKITGQLTYGAVAIHDRFETQEEYDALSR
jgi:hypothetical protein